MTKLDKTRWEMAPKKKEKNPVQFWATETISTEYSSLSYVTCLQMSTFKVYKH
jgi:hypothetical protein